MKNISIDLYSDTITRPTPDMRRFISEAEVGDEQKKEDPTVNRLVEMVCELTGKDDAVFLPTGTMCNQIAVRVFCGAGDEIIMDQTAHVANNEVGGAAALSGVSTLPLQGRHGIFSATQVESAIRPDKRHHPSSRMILIEQTSNAGGGSIWPLETIQEISALAKEHGLAMHMDGARLFNASIATGISAREYAANFDSVYIDFTKGLGAPVGSALAGSKDFISQVWRWKHQFGGAMRQAGIIAAGAVYALEHHIDRLADDHRNAQTLARGLADLKGIAVEPVETNLVFADVSDLGVTAKAFNELLQEHGLRVSIFSKFRFRAVTHLDVSEARIEEAISIFRKVVESL